MSSPPNTSTNNEDKTNNLETLLKDSNSTKTRTQVIRETIEILRNICHHNREGEEKILQKELLARLQKLIALENELIETRRTISKLNEKYAQLSQSLKHSEEKDNITDILDNLISVNDTLMALLNYSVEYSQKTDEITSLLEDIAKNLDNIIEIREN